LLSADVVVIGGGIAGSTAALAAARKGAEVVLLTKLSDPEEANTRHAQGGIVYTGPHDSPGLLVRDILESGAGNRAAAELLSREGPPLVRRLLIEDLEVPFDREADGFEGLHLALEGAHSVPRILHHRDATGREMQQALTRAVRAEERLTLLTGTEALDLAVSCGRCVGVYAARDGEILAVLGRGVVLATGGLGALYEHTTNPSATTGDGFALALRAGARVRDLHYVQFHPTALYVPGGDSFLVSEAVRGEGGVLRDLQGREFVGHALGSLAPRDVVAREIWAMMERTGSPCAYLDTTHRTAGWLEERFPTIPARCSSEGIDVAREPVPVVPAAHYACGGVETDLSGRTSLRGLWAAGEVASTGLHGSNRLASTSLLEGLVFGWRAGEDAAHPAPVVDLRSIELPTGREAAPEEAWRRLRSVMWEKAGLVRTAQGLGEGLLEVRALEEEFGGTALSQALTVARTVLEGALSDRRSRGCHYRLDVEEEGTLADLPG
jgi:L-aspartate oxidase